MILYVGKILLTAMLVVAINELVKRNALAGAVLASVPLVSVLSMIWLYGETRDGELLARFSMNVFWMVMPSLSFFACLAVLLRKGVPFVSALSASLVLMVILYLLMVLVLERMGFKF